MKSFRDYLKEDCEIKDEIDRIIESGKYKETKLTDFNEGLKSKISKIVYSQDYKQALQDLIELLNHNNKINYEFAAEKISKIYTNVDRNELIKMYDKLTSDELKTIAIAETLTEAAPPSKEAKLWMKQNKDEFKKEHGEGWEGALYATAWDMYNDGEFGDPDKIEDKGEDIEDEELGLNEKAPPSDEAEKWIEDNKDKFKDQYGDDEYKEILYSTAWKLYNKGTFTETTAPSTTTSGVAGHPQPAFTKQKNFGYNSIAVDGESFHKLMYKQMNKHWKNYLRDPKSEFGKAIRKEYNKNRKLILKNSETGEMVFIK